MVPAETFPLNQEVVKAFSDLKEKIGKALMHSIDETLIVETDASD